MSLISNCNSLAALSMRILPVVFVAGIVAGCQEDDSLGHGRAFRPIPERVLARMDEVGANKYSPVLIRTFKKESELEVWKMKADGTYAHLKTYPMCRWSGQLGPKQREGDRQVPEGFYSITPKHMNPRSAYYLSFNTGYPNTFDRAHGRTGKLIMVHGACSSRGCFSMTDKQIAEIYAVVREAFSGGQKAIQLQSLPFRMTPKNLAKHRLDKNIQFWKQLKEGADHFEVAKREPKVTVCNRKYVFNATPVDPSSRVNPRGACPALKRDETLVAAVKKKQRADQAKVAQLASKQVRPVKLVYADGGQHRSFANVMVVSRPEALARGPIEIALDTKGRPLKDKSAKTKLAKANSNSGKIVVAGANSKTKKEKAKTLAKVKTGDKTVKRVADTSAKPIGKASAAIAPAPAKRSIVKRWFGRLTSGFATQKPAAEPASPTKLVVPRSDRKANRTPARHTKSKSDRRASILPKIIRGAHVPLPPNLSAYAPLHR